MQDQKLQQEVKKLQEEIKKLEAENSRSGSSLETILSWLPFITALIAVIGLFSTLWKQLNESSRQRELDRREQERNRQQQQRDNEQRREDNRRRLEEKFTAIVTNLGDKSPSVRASAAVSILTFLQPEHEAFHSQVFLILLANLKVEHDQTLNNLLVSGFEKAIRMEARIGKKAKDFVLDASRCRLDRVDLSDLDLTGADFAFSRMTSAKLTDSVLFRILGREAVLEKARFSRSRLGEARLQKAKLNGAQFHESELVAADLRETDLRNASFQRASMQSAHLERADLSDARFESANLNDAFFWGATFTQDTLRSITKAHHWEKAHFDSAVKLQLKNIAGKKASAAGQGF